MHIVFEYLPVELVGFRVTSLNYEFGAENVGEFCTIAVPPTCRLFLLIIIV